MGIFFLRSAIIKIFNLQIESSRWVISSFEALLQIERKRKIAQIGDSNANW
jgi:hypothetical protein